MKTLAWMIFGIVSVGAWFLNRWVNVFVIHHCPAWFTIWFSLSSSISFGWLIGSWFNKIRGVT